MGATTGAAAACVPAAGSAGPLLVRAKAPIATATTATTPRTSAVFPRLAGAVVRDDVRDDVWDEVWDEGGFFLDGLDINKPFYRAWRITLEFDRFP